MFCLKTQEIRVGVSLDSLNLIKVIIKNNTLITESTFNPLRMPV